MRVRYKGQVLICTADLSSSHNQVPINILALRKNVTLSLCFCVCCIIFSVLIIFLLPDTHVFYSQAVINHTPTRGNQENERGVEGQFADGTWHAPAGIDHACGLGSSHRDDSRVHVHVDGIALAIMDAETLVQDSGKGTRPRRDLWMVDPRRVGSHFPALDPAVGRQRATVLRHVFGVLHL